MSTGTDGGGNVAAATFDIAVIGGGPAGLNAVAAAAEAGATTVLFDERLSTGADGPESAGYAPLVARAAAAGVEARAGRLVWGIFAGHRLAVSGPGESYEVIARAVVLATGAATVTDPTPGWTQPDIRLALMAECAAGYSASLGGWVPGRTRYLETSIPGVFVAGDGGGLCQTQDVATAEGRLAGLSAAVSLGFGSAGREEAVAELERIAPARQDEVAALDAWYIQGSHSEIPLAESYSPELPTIEPTSQDDQAGRMVCPCEGIGESAILAAIAHGARSLNDVKRRTRAGMGVCQGVQCGRPIRELLCEQTGLDPALVPPMTSRPPVRLLRLADLAGRTG